MTLSDNMKVLLKIFLLVWAVVLITEYEPLHLVIGISLLLGFAYVTIKDAKEKQNK